MVPVKVVSPGDSGAGQGSSQGNGGGGLYQKEAKIYPREIDGRFDRLRKLAVVVLLGLFYGVVWLTWDDRQAVLFDLPARKFYIWGLTLWPQDFIYLALILLFLALSLFFFTAIGGRLWCGYACPQTVWTEAFLLMERWVEGKRQRRMKLDKGPWNANRWLKKTAKHGLWIIFSLWTGMTFVGYFMPIRELAASMVALDLHPLAWFWLLFYGFATYGNAGFLREQVCKYMCPYARFQSAMFDRDTLIISYDTKRGEPRGKRSRGADPATLGLGDCINCTMCVQVCPTGIDIRDGLQYECIACAACIDACDQVMDRVGYPRGLIRYATENSLENPEEDAERHPILRPRTLIYGTLLTLIAVGMSVSLLNRVPLRMEVLRDRNALYRELADGRIENVYTLKVINMSDQPQTYALTVRGLEDVSLETPELRVPAGQAEAFPLRLQAPRAAGAGSRPIDLTLTSTGDNPIEVQRDSRFFLPIGSRL
ncbi:MAG: cytochrome c oxidase accessory protein CcoG [Pseudomonadota bacterium]